MTDHQNSPTEQDLETCDCTSRGHAWDHWRRDHESHPIRATILENALDDLDVVLNHGWEVSYTPNFMTWRQDDLRSEVQAKRKEKMARYLELFDAYPSDFATQNNSEADSTDDDVAQDDLERTYSIDTVVTTKSDFAHAQMMAQAANSEGPDFRYIGNGDAGVVFAQEGKSLVFKVARNDPAKLRNDHQMHSRVMEAFDTRPIPGIAIPRVHQFIEESDTYFFENRPKLALRAKAKKCTIPTTVIVSDLILPLPERIRDTLIDKYCDESIKVKALSDPSNTDCIARVYLGRLDTVVTNSRLRSFTLRNFLLYLTRVIDMGFDPVKIAQCIARALAVLHWTAGVDGRDVEFVLGSSSVKDPEYHFATEKFREDFHHRSIQLWMLDFNLVQEFSRDSAGIDQAVKAWKDNDPYFPKPCSSDEALAPYWAIFKRCYLRESSEILQHEPVEIRLLPFIFIHRIQAVKRTDWNPHVYGELYNLIHSRWELNGVTESPIWLDS